MANGTGSRFDAFVDKWSTPTVVIALVTALIFIINLNRTAEFNSTHLEKIGEKMDEMSAAAVQAALVLERTTTMQGQIIKRLEALEANQSRITEALVQQQRELSKMVGLVHSHQRDGHGSRAKPDSATE